MARAFNMYCANEKVGWGWRIVVPLQVGYKHARLFCPGAMSVFVMPRALYEQANKAPANPKAVLRLMDKMRRRYENARRWCPVHRKETCLPYPKAAYRQARMELGKGGGIPRRCLPPTA